MFDPILLEALAGVERGVPVLADGFTDADLTVQVCWDADRLDLGRVGIEPIPEKLCTEPARDSKMIAWAYRRSLNE